MFSQTFIVQTHDLWSTEGLLVQMRPYGVKEDETTSRLNSIQLYLNKKDRTEMEAKLKVGSKVTLTLEVAKAQ